MSPLISPAGEPARNSRPAPGTRALVLGGGGAAGNAWELGVVAGLAAGGIDVSGVDLLVGTSAGATAAAMLLGPASAAELYAATLNAPSLPQRSPSAISVEKVPAARALAPPKAPAQDYLDWSARIIAASVSAADMRRRMGAATLAESGIRDGTDPAGAPETTGDADPSRRWRRIAASRLPGAQWPVDGRRLLITAVDAHIGEPAVFDGNDGTGIIDAVAASTSPRTPYPIAGRRYIDGGFRRNENADLAASCERVLVFSPFGGRSRMPREWGMDLADQVAELVSAGCLVEVLCPDDAAGQVFNARAVDPATRPGAARAGYRQGLALAPSLGWMASD